MMSDNSAVPVNRWVPLVVGMYLEICGGSVYITSLYLTTVKDLWFPDNGDADMMMQQLVFASNLGCWLPFAGLFFDSRVGGPRNTVLVGAVLTLLGYGGLWLCAAHPTLNNFGLLWIFWFMWGHGAGYFDCAVIATSAHNFPGARGKVMGVVKAFYGLSGSLLTQIYRAFFSGDGQVPGFLLFLGLAQSAFAVMICPLLRRCVADALAPCTAFASRDAHPWALHCRCLRQLRRRPCALHCRCLRQLRCPPSRRAVQAASRW